MEGFCDVHTYYIILMFISICWCTEWLTFTIRVIFSSIPLSCLQNSTKHDTARTNSNINKFLCWVKLQNYSGCVQVSLTIGHRVKYIFTGHFQLCVIYMINTIALSNYIIQVCAGKIVMDIFILKLLQFDRSLAFSDNGNN